VKNVNAMALFFLDAQQKNILGLMIYGMSMDIAISTTQRRGKKVFRKLV